MSNILRILLLVHCFQTCNQMTMEETIWNHVEREHNRNFRPIVNNSDALTVRVESQLVYLLNIVSVQSNYNLSS